MIPIATAIDEFKNSLQPEKRFASFDFCYNYFYRTSGKELTDNIEKSCYALGFYLASWGMMRGSSFLLQKSARHYIPLIEYIAKLDKEIWQIDADEYSESNMKQIIEIYHNIKASLIPGKQAGLTLITKVMLGVFGFVPAFDQYFCNTFRELYGKQCGFRSFNYDALSHIRDFYQRNKTSINQCSDSTFTYDFIKGEPTQIKYPKAKIIDMYGFIAGLRTGEFEEVKKIK